MPVIAFIGAGSVVFGKNVVADILAHDALRDSELRLMDIDAERLRTAGDLARRIDRELDAAATVVETDDRRRAVDGADVVICAMGVGGHAAARDDLVVPFEEFGLVQTVGDTLGAGGVFRAARSIPVLLDLCADMAELCPDALLLNYVNPMAMHCLAVRRATDIACVGLCHGVRNTARSLRMYVEMRRRGVSPDEIDAHLARPWGDPKRIEEWIAWDDFGKDPDLDFRCFGINHMAFFLELASGGDDLLPELRACLDAPHIRRLDPVRFDLYERLGFFMTETSAHTSEYVPWILRHERERKRLALDPNIYLRTCEEQDRAYLDLRDALAEGAPLLNDPYELSVEYAAPIINAVATGEPFRFNGNVHNDGGRIVPNLPADCCVETPCVADGDGVTPEPQAPLPPQCAALIRTDVNVQDLAVRAVLEGRPDHLRHALMLDPNTAATLPLPDIDRLCERMVRVHAERLPRSLR